MQLGHMYVCMPVISSYLGAPCPTQRGSGQVLTNPTIEVGKEVPRHSQYGLMLMVSPQHMYRWRTGLWNRPRDLKIHANFPTPPHQNHKDPPEFHDHDRNSHWKGYQSIQWRPWNQAVFRWTKNWSARRKNTAFLRGTAEKTHPTIIDRAESRRPKSQRPHGVSDQINQRLVSP